LKEPGFSFGKTEILYLKPEYMFKAGQIIRYTETENMKMGLPVKTGDIGKFYTSVGKVKTTNPEKIYATMQAETWKNHAKKMQKYLESKGITSDSMMVGDAILVGKRLMIVNGHGFIKINLE